MGSDQRVGHDPSATCTSRRRVVAGAGAMALATAALSMRRVLAEDGTPVASPAAGEGEESAPPSWLFTQTFTGGDWEKTDDPTRFILHLRGGLASTVGFTDRPNRDFTVMPTADLLPRLWDDPTNPPNAAIIVEDAGTQYTFLLVLTDPAYDEATDTITYTVSVLDAYEGDGLGAAVERVADGTLPHSFGAGAIFIDSIDWCRDSQKACRRFEPGCDAGCRWLARGHLAGSEQFTPTCYVGGAKCNLPCPKGTTAYDEWCNAAYADWCYALHPEGCRFGTDDLYDTSCTCGSGIPADS